MKKISLLLILINTLYCNGQNFFLKITSSSPVEKTIIDSINYTKKHNNLKTLLEEINKFDTLTTKIGYLERKLTKQEKINDTTFHFNYSLGKRTNYLYIYLGNNKSILNQTKDTLKIKTNQIKEWTKSTIKNLEKKGYPLVKLRLTNYKKTNNTLSSDLKIDLNNKRTFDDLIILGHDNFPKNIKRSIIRNLKKQDFNQKNIAILHKELNELTFTNQIKYPEVLFTKDSTKIFAYLEKSKPNKFEGYIGFSNNSQDKLSLNGYFDLQLQNIFNSAEKLTLYWKNDGNKQSIFNITTEFPYLLKTSSGIRTKLQIFKQDSIFQNTSSEIQIGYYFNINNKTFLGIQKTTSTNTQNSLNNPIKNYQNIFYTLTYEHIISKKTKEPIRKNTEINIKTGIGKRKDKENTNRQFFAEIDIKQNISLNNYNNILIRTQNYILNSNTYLPNELYRFGGTNSIRGFRENSLQANLLTSLITEYQYSLSPSLYLHTVIDFAYFEDNINKTKKNTVSLGLGFAIQTKNGTFNLIYANGTTKNQAIKLSNSIIQIQFKTSF